jgi:hypothetical protein
MKEVYIIWVYSLEQQKGCVLESLRVGEAHVRVSLSYKKLAAFLLY